MTRKKQDPDLLPIFEITFEEDDKKQGIKFVSLVNDPAIEVKGMYFNNDVKQYSFKKIEEQMKVVGPAMIPEKLILRMDGDREYYVKFSADTIKKMFQKFNKENNNKSINIDHSKRMIDGFIEQNWIIEDNQYDKSKMYGYELPIGTAFIEIKVENEDDWNEIKELGKYSFSIEGMMGMSPYRMVKNHVIDYFSDEEILELAKSIIE